MDNLPTLIFKWRIIDMENISFLKDVYGFARLKDFEISFNMIKVLWLFGFILKTMKDLHIENH
jgi:hypothetical protein